MRLVVSGMKHARPSSRTCDVRKTPAEGIVPRLVEVVIMTRVLLSLSMAAALVAWAGPPPESRDGNDRRKCGESPAVALEREVERLAAANSKEGMLWPGFDPLAVPLAVCDGERTFLFRHPAPPQGFIPVQGAAPSTRVRSGRHEAVTANSSAEVGGVQTATILLDGSREGRSLPSLAAVAVHEAFHAYQRSHHPRWTANELDLFAYPTDAAGLLALRRLETEALRQALTAEEAGAACWARGALALRKERYAGMDSAFSSYERATELNEGLATYVEARAAGRRTVDLPAAEFGTAEVRRRAYATGHAIAILLDRFMPGWQAKLEADDGRTLDETLAAALGTGNTCTFGEDVHSGADRNARTDVAALAAERARRLAAFEGKPGWRVVVEVGGGEPLWPQGFDPSRVETVGGKSVLHTRFLRLGNGAGRLEMLNAEALTEGAGAHPLFQGIRRVVLTGLAEPEVSEAEGKVSVRTAHLTMEFRGATVAQSGEVVTVRLGSS